MLLDESANFAQTSREPERTAVALAVVVAHSLLRRASVPRHMLSLLAQSDSQVDGCVVAQSNHPRFSGAEAVLAVPRELLPLR